MANDARLQSENVVIRLRNAWRFFSPCLSESRIHVSSGLQAPSHSEVLRLQLRGLGHCECELLAEARRVVLCLAQALRACAGGSTSQQFCLEWARLTLLDVCVCFFFSEGRQINSVERNICVIVYNT